MLKSIPRTSTVAWCPSQSRSLLATGTVAGALDASFSSTTELEIFELDFRNSNQTGENIAPAGKVEANAR